MICGTLIAIHGRNRRIADVTVKPHKFFKWAWFILLLFNISLTQKNLALNKTGLKYPKIDGNASIEAGDLLPVYT